MSYTQLLTPPLPPFVFHVLGINSFKTFMAYKGVFMVRDDEVRLAIVFVLAH